MGEKIADKTKISGHTTVEQWKSLRNILLQDINKLPQKEWDASYSIFEKRIETRFLKPIRYILQNDSKQGEGFTVVAIQCILIEFLEAFYQGKVYTPKRDNLWLHEYNSSKQLFKDFLLSHSPFKECFTAKLANNFYTNIRCGLLHEAQTKETSKIRAHSSENLIKELDKGNMIIYRTNFQQGLEKYISTYKEELLASTLRKRNFIRKLDDICGIEHTFYFAYGSNMKISRLLKRMGESEDSPKVHDLFVGCIHNYKFVFNKKGKDGTAKANITEENGAMVWGVCYEIDKSALAILDKYEGGYQQIVLSMEISEGVYSRVITYISHSTFSAPTPPSQNYLQLVLDGAKQHNLPYTYQKELGLGLLEE